MALLSAILQRCVHSQRQFFTHARHSSNGFNAGDLDGAHAAKTGNQRFSTLGADTCDVVQTRPDARFLAPVTVTRQGEAVGFIADFLNEMQARIIRIQVQGFAFFRKDQRF